MKKHTKIYLDYFGYDDTDWIGCEVCGKTAVDIHHIENRKMGGSELKDTPENLQALCRSCHVLKGDLVQYKDELKRIHFEFMESRI